MLSAMLLQVMLMPRINGLSAEVCVRQPMSLHAMHHFRDWGSATGLSSTGQAPTHCMKVSLSSCRETFRVYIFLTRQAGCTSCAAGSKLPDSINRRILLNGTDFIAFRNIYTNNGGAVFCISKKRAAVDHIADRQLLFLCI